MAQGKNACDVAPENFANGQAINPLNRINTMDAPVNDKAATGSKDLEDSEIKIQLMKKKLENLNE
jgi:hypothetical protein